MIKQPGGEYNYLLSIARPDQFKRILKYLFDEKEFFSPYGIRSLSKYHEEKPFVLELEGKVYTVPYTPGESRSNLFGGNSNWRGPIWMPGLLVVSEIFLSLHTFCLPLWSVFATLPCTSNVPQLNATKFFPSVRKI